MTWTSLVPQIFYDGIARLSGGLAVASAAAAIWSPQLFSNKEVALGLLKEFGVSAAFGVMLLLYVSAFIIDGIRRIPRFIRSSKKKRRLCESERYLRLTSWKRCRKAYRKVHKKYHTSTRPGEALAIDLIRLASTEAGARVVKLRAEIALCKTLYAGWILVSVSALIAGIFPNLDTSTPIALFFLACSAGAFLARRNLQVGYYHSLYNHWLILIAPKSSLVPRRDEPDV